MIIKELTYMAVAGSKRQFIPELAFTNPLIVKKEGLGYDLSLFLRVGSVLLYPGNREYKFDPSTGEIRFKDDCNDGERIFVLYTY